MRKAILMMLLAGVSSSAAAEWVRVGSSEKTTVYVDTATIRKAGDMVKMWDLLDYKTPETSATGVKRLSSKTQYEYDCKEERARILYFSWYSGNMGGGAAVYTNSNPANWEPLPPDSITESLWKFACGKR